MKEKDWKEFEATNRTPENEKYFKVNTLTSTTTISTVAQAENSNYNPTPTTNQRGGYRGGYGRGNQQPNRQFQGNRQGGDFQKKQNSSQKGPTNGGNYHQRVANHKKRM